MDTEIEQQQEAAQGQRAIGRTQCGACKQYFVGASIFDQHRVGSYGDAVYAEGDAKRKRPVGYTKSSRRCMTEEEMRAAGLETERRRVRIIKEGKESFLETDVWYNVASRESVVSAYRSEG